MLVIKNRDLLFSALKNGATVITPNNRLSNQLIEDAFKYINPDRTPIDKPHCLPYLTFLKSLFKKLRHQYANITHPLLLNPSQQHHLWRQLLAKHQDSCHDGLLFEIEKAWTYCQHWQIDQHHPSFAKNRETRQFQQLCQEFQQYLQQLGAITEEQLARYLLSYPDLFHNIRVIWACFDDYTPIQRQLQQTIQEQGKDQYAYDLDSEPNTTHLYEAKDTEDEYLQMIAWLKEKLANNETRMAAVIPNLQRDSAFIQRLLEKHLPLNAFNLSLGQPLIEYPLVAHALLWLSLDNATITNHQARLILHSPFLKGSQTEWQDRAFVMQNSKLLQEMVIPMVSFIKVLTPIAPKLADLLQNISEYPKKTSVRLWINHFKDRLIELGFPGEYALDSSNYQCFQRFLALLDELLPISLLTPLMSTEEALDTLKKLAKSTIFQAKKAAAPIQILGLLEASGSTFDSIWVCGLTDHCLPQKTKLSAFIPIELQLMHEMPHALPERELQFAKTLLQRLQDGCQNCMFSYPKQTGDILNLVCPLIKHLPSYPGPLFIPSMPPSKLRRHTEDYVIPITSSETISGGTALLANQAKCPFRAFAAHRLHAKTAQSVSQGLNPLERGQVIHHILERFWLSMKNQQTLLAYDKDKLDEMIKRIIQEVLTPFSHERCHSFSPLIQEVESSRLLTLMKAALEWEKRRPSFTVEAIEQSFTIQLSGIDFLVRIDRLDRVLSDKQWMIDYKTSLPSTKPWNEERPEAPQLLLYALLDDTINALLFVEFKAGRITCSGLSEQVSSIPGVSALKKEESWSARQLQWEQQLTQLADEFRRGHCPPEPTRQSTCLQCDFPHLCRIE